LSGGEEGKTPGQNSLLRAVDEISRARSRTRAELLVFGLASVNEVGEALVERFSHSKPHLSYG
jgi:hypothetical protein